MAKEELFKSKLLLIVDRVDGSLESPALCTGIEVCQLIKDAVGGVAIGGRGDLFGSGIRRLLRLLRRGR